MQQYIYQHTTRFILHTRTHTHTSAKRILFHASNISEKEMNANFQQNIGYIAANLETSVCKTCTGLSWHSIHIYNIQPIRANHLYGLRDEARYNHSTEQRTPLLAVCLCCTVAHSGHTRVHTYSIESSSWLCSPVRLKNETNKVNIYIFNPILLLLKNCFYYYKHTYERCNTMSEKKNSNTMKNVLKSLCCVYHVS